MKRHGRLSFDALFQRQARFTVSHGRTRIRDITVQNVAKRRSTQTTQGSADMAVTQAIPITRHPYADGSYKKMLIDGKWVDAASGKRFEQRNPATARFRATAAEGHP